MNKLFKIINLFESNLKKTAWIILIYNNQLVIGKRSKFCNNPGQWNFVGGTIDKNELPIQAAIRETFEETKLRIPINQLELVTTIDNAYYYVYNLTSLDNLKITKETEKYKLVSFDKLPKNLHYSIRNFIKKYSIDNLL